MIRHAVDQGGPEWKMLRLGIPTASQFDRILTPKTMKPSSSQEKYALELIAEQLLGVPMDDDVSSAFMQRGQVQEKKALDYYSLRHPDAVIEPAGFIMRDDERVGASPDQFVDTNGLLEIKVPNAANHIGYLLDTEGIGYRCQVQGQLWIAEREWSDTLSYNPELPPALVRVYRDDKFIAVLAQTVNQFLTYVDELKVKLQKSHGLFEGFEQPDIKVA